MLATSLLAGGGGGTSRVRKQFLKAGPSVYVYMYPQSIKQASTMGIHKMPRFSQAILQLDRDTLQFGVVKKNYYYRAHVLIKNSAGSSLRWRVVKKGTSGNKDVFHCTTPAGRLAPGLSQEVGFELRASQSGQHSVDFLIEAKADEIEELCTLHLSTSAISIGSQHFQAHICRSRYQQKPLLAQGVKCLGKLPPAHGGNNTQRPETDSEGLNETSMEPKLPAEVSAQLDSLSEEDAEDLACLPHFPSCVYDPSTKRLTIDHQQLSVHIDPNLSLDALIASSSAEREARMASLEAGGYLTSRILDSLQ